jgi:hypothetical protein
MSIPSVPLKNIQNPNELPKELKKSPQKSPDMNLKRMNSLKQAVINDKEEPDQHSQALQELLQAIDNPTIPKYQSITSDNTLYVKGQNKKNIALDVVDEKIEEEVIEYKPIPPTS